MRGSLIAARNGKGYSQREMARRVGMDRSSYALIETGARNPSLATAIAIGKALGRKIDPDGLFENREDK